MPTGMAAIRRLKSPRSTANGRLIGINGLVGPRLQSGQPFSYRNGLGGRSCQIGQLSNGCGCSSGVEHDLAKVGVEGSNPFARSNLRSFGASVGKPVSYEGCPP